MASKAASATRILITTGDPDGIGWEVTAKALSAIGPKAGIQFVYFRHTSAVNLGPKLKRFKTSVVSGLDAALAEKFDSKTAIEVRSPKAPGHWVEEAARACMKGSFQALVTAPLSKTSIVAAGLHDIGHTEILSRISGQRDLFMGFYGSKFAVVLATGHSPLSQALLELTPDKLGKALQAAKTLRAILPGPRAKLPVALVGLNPHAGEQGLIGKEEGWFKEVIARLKAPGFDIQGPLVPDAAFQPANWKRYSVYVTPYHDQGLIPFKMVHGFDGGVHLTLGLPFVRTSVDHGTAKEIFGKNKAQAGSMKDALLAAIRLGVKK
jgi:4-hydroxythreonine-4-phosphate dehydrogenase